MARLACYLASHRPRCFSRYQQFLGCLRSPSWGKSSGRMDRIPHVPRRGIVLHPRFPLVEASESVAPAESSDRHLRLYRCHSRRVADHDGPPSRSMVWPDSSPVFVVTSEIDSQLRSLAGGQRRRVQRTSSASGARRQSQQPSRSTGLRKHDPAWSRRQVCAWYGEQALAALQRVQGLISHEFLRFVQGRFRDLVRDGDSLYLRAAELASDSSIEYADRRYQ